MYNSAVPAKCPSCRNFSTLKHLGRLTSLTSKCKQVKVYKQHMMWYIVFPKLMLCILQSVLHFLKHFASQGTTLTGDENQQ